MKMIKICEETICTGCSECAEMCPKQCISMCESYDGFLYPTIDHNRCISCGLCQKTCPNNKDIEKSQSSFYMAIHKDKDVLKNSSSGGAFTGLAKLVLNRNGYVAGAFMNPETKEVKHIIVDNVDELEKLRLSKYYQSNTDGVYKRVLAYLKQDKYVMFSGTACQIAALFSIVPEELGEKLLTVDILCHGVSSKKVIDSYIQSEEKKFKKKIIDYRFRIKEVLGWHSGGGTKMKLIFEDGSYYIEEKSVDTFFMAFNKNAVLRESCYSCKYCGTERISDFTIADFWGVTEQRANKQKQQEGISLLVCNSEKARRIIEELRRDMYIEKINQEEAIPYNNAFSQPNSRPIERDEFFSRLHSGEDFQKIVKELYKDTYFNMSVKKILGPKIVSIIKKIKKRV